MPRLAGQRPASRLGPPLRAIHRHLRDHVVPHEGNDYHPHALRHGVLFGYSVILILLKAIVILGPVALPSSSLYSSAITAQNIIDLTNQTRVNLGLDRLTANPALARAAAAKAADMLANRYFAHTSPGGVTPWDWIRRAGYRYRYAGENLAVHYHEAEDVEAGWLASPSHRANIVNARYTEIGVGVVTGQFEGATATVVAQLFGRPAAAGQATSAAEPINSASQAVPEAAALSAAPARGAVAAAESVAPPLTALARVVAPPTILEPSVVVRPAGASYRVRVAVDDATNVAVQLGGKSTPLARAGASDVWAGLVPYDPAVLGPTGEPLVLTAVNEGGVPATATLALVAPTVSTQRLYAFNEGSDRFATFFGFIRVGNLDDAVRRFYLYFMVALGASFLFNMFFVQLRARHPSVLGHTAAVIALAGLLVLI